MLAPVLFAVLAAAAQTPLDAERARHDGTSWRAEVAAQNFGKPVTKLWDDLRAAGADPVKTARVFTALELERVEVPDGAARSTLKARAWRRFIEKTRKQGWVLAQSEWHQVDLRRFEFTLHLENRETGRREIVEGDFSLDGKRVAVHHLERRGSDAAPWFTKGLEFRAEPNDAEGLDRALSPWLAYDLDADGDADLVLPRLNAVYWNEGPGRFSAAKRLLASDPANVEGALLADFTGDGLPDLVLTHRGAAPTLHRGAGGGAFEAPRALEVAGAAWTHPVALSAGDIDGDADLDLFIGQYKLPYLGGQMPTPYYDAVDGDPAYLLRNDGTGTFSDVTAAAGLGAKRRRRTYTASLADLDGDGDLDLLTVNDFAGPDLHLNDGTGRFSDATERLLPDSRAFGMSHAFGDFDGDGRRDVFVVGMHSYTVERLEALGAKRPDEPVKTGMRVPMTYGNRMFLGTASGPFSNRLDSRVTRRTGWSWGTAAFDVDNDGDDDLYVGNGNISGRSASDYCTTFWRHDIYSGDSEPDPGLASFFDLKLEPLRDGRTSWNGWEHNRLLVNASGTGFEERAFLEGVAFEFDSRSVLAEDWDRDGGVDLLVEEFSRAHPARGHLMVNRAPRENWIGVRLRPGPKVPAVGALIRVKAGGRVREQGVWTGDVFRGQRSNGRHFGLGETAAVDWIEVRWPDGHTTREDAPAAGRWHEFKP